MNKSPAFQVHHERCVCGHCRCEHVSGYQDCRACERCVRYTWPGHGADLPADHRRAPESAR